MPIDCIQVTLLLPHLLQFELPFLSSDRRHLQLAFDHQIAYLQVKRYPILIPGISIAMLIINLLLLPALRGDC